MSGIGQAAVASMARGSATSSPRNPFVPLWHLHPTLTQAGVKGRAPYTKADANKQQPSVTRGRRPHLWDQAWDTEVRVASDGAPWHSAVKKRKSSSATSDTGPSIKGEQKPRPELWKERKTFKSLIAWWRKITWLQPPKHLISSLRAIEPASDLRLPTVPQSGPKPEAILFVCQRGGEGKVRREAIPEILFLFQDCKNMLPQFHFHGLYYVICTIYCDLVYFTCTVLEMLSCLFTAAVHVYSWMWQINLETVKSPPVVWPFVKSFLIPTSSILFLLFVFRW